MSKIVCFFYPGPPLSPWSPNKDFFKILTMSLSLLYWPLTWWKVSEKTNNRFPRYKKVYAFVLWSVSTSDIINFLRSTCILRLVLKSRTSSRTTKSHLAALKRLGTLYIKPCRGAGSLVNKIITSSLAPGSPTKMERWIKLEMER